MLKIRLRRMGSRHRPFYRIVVSDSRRTPLASALDEIGYYDPRKQPATLDVDVARVDHWVSQGAKPSKTVERLIEKVRAGGAVPAGAPAAAAAPAPAEAEAPKAEEPKAEKAEQATAEEPKAEDSQEDAPKAEEPQEDAAEAAPVEDAPADEASAEDAK